MSVSRACGVRALLRYTTACLIAWLSASAGPQPLRAQPAASGDAATVTISQPVDVDNLDPFTLRALPQYNVLVQMYDTLATLDPAGRLEPSLALSFKRIAPTVWEFKLRHGVRFWNGDPFTSDDVRFTIEKIRSPHYVGLLRARVETIASVETPDPYTVRYVTRKPTPIIPGRPYGIFIVDAKYWRAHGDAYMATHPMGSGPFVLRSWEKDEALELDANSAYWHGTPAVRHVSFRPIPEAAARVAALETGASDLITNVPAHDIAGLGQRSSVRVETTRGTQILFVAFNLRQPGPQHDRRVRQAFNYAVDIPAIVDALLFGRAEQLNSPIPPGYVGYDARSQAYPHDLAKARALLAEAGYPEGRGLEMTLHAPTGRFSMDAEIAQAVAGQLAATGAKVDVQLHDPTSYLTDTDQHRLGPMYLLGWTNNTYDADDSLTNLLTSQSRFSTYDTPAFDALVRQARYEMDPAQRLRLYARALRYIHDEAPAIFLFRYDLIFGVAQRLRWEARPDGYIFCRDMRLESTAG